MNTSIEISLALARNNITPFPEQGKEMNNVTKKPLESNENTVKKIPTLNRRGIFGLNCDVFGESDAEWNERL